MKPAGATLLLLGLLSSLPGGASAGEQLPPALQAALFHKIALYDKTLEGKEARVLVVQGSDGPAAERMASAFRAEGMPGSAVVKPGEVAARIGEAQLLYFTAGSYSPALRDLCARSKVLTLAASPELAEAADASVALGLKPDGRPQIIIAVRRVKAEAHELSASLLRLARIVE